MSDIIGRLMPAHYSLRRVGIEQKDGAIISILDLVIHNADGEELGVDHPEAVLSPGERQTVVAYTVRALNDYEVATGLTKWIEPEEQEESE